jgi:hypothetical protein
LAKITPIGLAGNGYFYCPHYRVGWGKPDERGVVELVRSLAFLC